jgi:lysophospholipase L1-like esterase
VLRAGIAAAVGSWAAVEVLGTSTASAEPMQRAEPIMPARISVVGDSLTQGTLPFQAQDLTTVGWSQSMIDAYVSRGVRTKVRADHYTGLTAVDAIRDKWGDTEAWVMALGTNDAVIYARDKHTQMINLMMDHIGSGHKVMWINVYLPERKAQQDAWNAALDSVSAERGEAMLVYDWASFAAENPRWLAHDRIHYSTDGYRYRSTAIGLASRDLLPSRSVSRWRLPPMKLLAE